MKNKLWKISICCGVLMIISSVLLCISNMLESVKAGERSENNLSSLKSQISSEKESPSEAVTQNAEEKSVSR